MGNATAASEGFEQPSRNRSEKRSIFISYSQMDRLLVEPVVAALERRGFEVWWDQKLQMIRWDREIEAQLDAAYRVVAFLTEGAVNSKLDYIFSEMKRAREQEKLVPLRIGDYRMPFSFEGLISLVRTYTFETAASVLESDGFEGVCRACGLAESTALPSAEPRKDALGRVQRWFTQSPSPELLAFAISLAVLEHAPLPDVRSAANELARILRPVEPAGGDTTAGQQPLGAATAQWQAMLAPRAERVQAIDAEVYQDTHSRLGVAQDCCRFKEPDRASALLLYFWQELDQLHEPLVRWLDHLAATVPAEARMRLGLALGRTAQVSFPSMFDQLLRRWALDEHQSRREVADIALSVASFEPGAVAAIKRIVGDWSRSASSPKHMKAAVELSCGYTGMRIPRLSIETLKSVARAKSRDMELIVLMKGAIAQMISAAVETGDNSLLDLAQLIEDLADWVQHPEPGDVSRLPMFLFLTTIEDLPLSKPDAVAGVLSLADVVSNDRTRLSLARVLSAALRDAGAVEIGPREQASSILRQWADDQRTAKHAADPVLTLARELLAYNTERRDQDRIAFLFRRFYSVEQLGL